VRENLLDTDSLIRLKTGPLCDPTKTPDPISRQLPLIRCKVRGTMPSHDISRPWLTRQWTTPPNSLFSHFYHGPLILLGHKTRRPDFAALSQAYPE
jgi:hypothetical protein